MIANRLQTEKPVLLDVSLLFVTILLVGFGLVMVYSTTGVVSQEKFGDELFFVKRQAAAAFLGIVLMYLCSRVRIESLRNFSPYGLLFSVIFLVLPLLPVIGDRAGGATRWVNFGLFRFQPGEFVKLSFIIFLAGYFARHEKIIPGFTGGMLKPLLFAGLVAGLFLLQPDFGSASVLMVVTLAMALAAGVRLRYIISCAVLCGISFAGLILVSPYRMRRVVSFLSPWEDASGKGYQLIQSLIAIGSGQWHGAGLGGSQQKLFFLPAAHTDFIFSVIAEELGFLGSVLVIFAFLFFLYRGLRLAGKLAGDTFCYSLAVGLTSLIVIPALLNVGVTTGLLPTKGMVLPLVGYGGSSLIACLIAVGMLLALWRKCSQSVK